MLTFFLLFPFLSSLALAHRICYPLQGISSPHKLILRETPLQTHLGVCLLGDFKSIKLTVQNNNHKQVYLTYLNNV